MPDTINNIKYRPTIVDGCLNGTHLLQNLLETVPLTLLERPPLPWGTAFALRPPGEALLFDRRSLLPACRGPGRIETR